MSAIMLDQQAALGDMRLGQCLGKVEHRGKGNILVSKPVDPFGLGLAGKGGAEKGDQLALFACRTIGDGDKVRPVKGGEQVDDEFFFPPAEDDMAVIGSGIDLLEGGAAERALAGRTR